MRFQIGYIDQERWPFGRNTWVVCGATVVQILSGILKHIGKVICKHIVSSNIILHST